jgi:hypothetical protein
MPDESESISAGRVTVSREDLYRQIWETPMSRLAKQYGISDNGLAKICNRINVPYPPRGYWAKKAAGKKVIQRPLPEWKNGVARAASIVPTPPRAPPPDVPPEIKKQIKAATEGTAVIVSERLIRPHPVIAGWLAEHERQQREARHNPILRAMMRPNWSETDHRRHRILDTLFKAAERQGFKVKEEKLQRLYFEADGEQIVFKLREKTRRVLRLPTVEERQRVASGLSRTNMEATGILVFAIETHLAPLPCIWTETADRPMETLVGDILATLLLAVPLLGQRRRDQAEAHRLRQEAEHRRRQEAELKRLDDNRWRRFVELAETRRQAETAREFLAALEQYSGGTEVILDGKTISDWLTWARERLDAFDPLRSGPGTVFEEILEVKAWTYRD